MNVVGNCFTPIQVFTYNFEELVPVYGRIKYDRYHTASTYSRAFRELRSSNVLDDLGFKLTEVKHKNNAKTFLTSIQQSEKHED